MSDKNNSYDIKMRSDIVGVEQIYHKALWDSWILTNPDIQLSPNNAQRMISHFLTMLFWFL